MIRRQLFLSCSALFAGISVGFAQNATAPASAPASSSAQPASAPIGQPAAPKTPSLEAVPENTPVITIEGICDVSPNGTVKPPARTATASRTGSAAAKATAANPAVKTSSPTDCKTQVTRAEFEKLTKAVAPPGVSPTVYRQIGTRYVQVITAANQGVKLGVEKDPDFTNQLSEQTSLLRLQMLAQYAERKLQAEAANVSEADEKAYYDQNPSAFEQVTLTRIFVPRSPNVASNATPASPATPPPDSSAIAESARQQLVAGEDPEKIQKSVYEQLKNTTAPPTTNFGTRRRGALAPTQEQKIFALKPHEVSEVISDSIGYAIYRVESKEELPFDRVKDEIKRKISQQHLEDSRQKIMSASKAEYNEAYFGPETANPRAAPAATATPATPSMPSIPPNSAPSARSTGTAQPANPK